jgi:polar amino acid transport system substrate-binding protein
VLEDAKLAGRIGVIADYSIEQFLVGQGFTNLVYCADNIDAFDKLLKGEIDLFPSDRITAEAALNSLNKTIYAVSEKLTIRTDMVYFAFNKKVPDDVVADFQQQIDILKEDGTLKELYRKFMSSSDMPGTLQLYTEQYPPITFRDNTGEITGFGTDLVKELMKRNQQFFDIKLSSWSNGYELALHNPNFCLFTMDRTALRENLFQWVGPIGTNTTWFYTKTGSGITISTLEEAKNLQAVGTVSSWFSDQYLRELGFTNLVSGSEPGVLATKLMNGEIDAFVCSGITFPVILKESGYEYSQVVPSYALMSSDYYIAFSKSTPAAFVSQWQSTLELLKQDGTVEAISKKWLP